MTGGCSAWVRVRVSAGPRGPCGEAGWASVLGPCGKKERADWVALGFLGRVLGFSWAGGFGLLGSFPFLLLFLFYFSLKHNYLNSKEILNSNPYEIKQLKQCISMNASTKLNLRKF